MNEKKKQVIVWEGIEEGYWDEEWGWAKLVKILKEGETLHYIFVNEDDVEIIMTVGDIKEDCC